MSKRPQVTMEECTHCGGLGKRPNGSTGAVMRLEREGRGVTRGEVTPFFYKSDGVSTYSETYLVDLERDSRAWSVGMVESFRGAIEAAVRARLEREEVGCG